MSKTFDVVVGNRFAVFPEWWLTEGATDDLDSGLPSWFCYHPVGWEHWPSVRAGRSDGFVCAMKGDLVGTGLFLAQRERMERNGFIFNVTEQRQWPQFWEEEGCTLANGKVPHQWQKDAAEFVRLNSHNGGIIVAPTGTGKTLMAAWVFMRLNGCGIFVVDDVALGMQTRTEFEALLGEPVGFVGDGKFSIERITVCIVQTLHKNVGNPDFHQLCGAAVMMVDELHVMLNKRMDAALAGYMPFACFGLTATIDLTQSAVTFPAWALCGPAVFTYTPQEARANGHISECFAYLVTYPKLVDASEASYAQCYKEHVVNDQALNTFAATLATMAVAQGYTVLILVREHDHVDNLVELLEGMDTEYLLYTGKHTGKARVYNKRLLADGDVRLAVGTTGAITKGINIPRLSFLIDLSQSKKWENTVQRAGRASRVMEGKDHFIFVDVGQAATKVRGVWKRNMFAVQARIRRAGLWAQGYTMRTAALESTYEPVTEAARILNQILEGS